MQSRANVFQRNRQPAAARWSIGGLWDQYKWWVIVPAILIIWANMVANVESMNDDLKDGHVPASDRGPDEHWGYIWDRKDKFVREYTRNAAVDSVTTKLFRVETLEDVERGYSVDAGGKFGHEPEQFDGRLGLDTSQGATRCSSTNYAVTAYFCGDAVAADWDDVDALSDASYLRKATLSGGLDKFEKVLDVALEADPPRRFVYRFGFSGTERAAEALADHVWVVVSRPDGSFWWLQSYIVQYSLGSWMEKSEGEGLNPIDAGELRRRVALLRELERETAQGWTKAQDDLYQELFNVRMSTARDRGGRDRGDERGGAWEGAPLWKGGRALFDVACEWPLKRVEPLEGVRNVTRLEGGESVKASEGGEGVEEYGSSVQ